LRNLLLNFLSFNQEMTVIATVLETIIAAAVAVDMAAATATAMETTMPAPDPTGGKIKQLRAIISEFFLHKTFLNKKKSPKRRNKHKKKSSI
jgi:hypothetical protein